MTEPCTAFGSALAALVDGELDHATRERAQAHLLHCDGCRTEVDAQRRLKAVLRGLTAPEPSTALLARLAAPAAGSPSRPAGAPRESVRPAGASRGPATRAPHVGNRGRRGPRRRTTVGSALAVLGVGVGVAVLTLGGGQRTPGVSVVPGERPVVVPANVDTRRRDVVVTVPVGASLLP